MSNEQLITQFYQSFADGNVEGMLECYHDDIVFEDPAFGVLKGESAKDMWRMLLQRSKGAIKIDFSDVQANANQGSAKWRAEYPYGPQKRKVINKISAQFEIKDGKIIKHTDTFDLWRWTQQALGLSGYLLGWTGFMQGKIRAKTNGLLKKFQSEK